MTIEEQCWPATEGVRLGATLNKTKILTDDPADEDEFGTHQKLAEVIEAEILNAQDGRSIAIVGHWGSGKSTIVTLLRRRLMSPEPPPAHVFVYDAWSHQGDLLRRAFLDDLIASLRAQGLISLRQARKATDKVWNRIETTTTTIEPLMRRHAKWLLFMLALIPFGWKLFDIPSATDKFWTEFFTGRNFFGALLLLALPLSVGGFWLARNCGPERLKRFLFDDDHKNEGFSVLSFFLEKVTGKAEHKRIKLPADSIGEFRGVFSKLLIYMQGKQPKMRLVIVIDNIDRIPADQAREFWSTMQTFFGDGGGSRRSFPQKYFLIAPFSEEALTFIFQDKVAEESADDVDARQRARGYINKTFGLAFYVPPPILANWRKYLLTKLREAFFEHDTRELVGVRDLYDYAISGAHVAITPRSMKLFVNSLVALYRQRGNEVSLAIMAAYEIHKDKIKAGHIGDDFLSAMDRRVIDVPDWRARVAALHFGVTPDEATQLLLQEPILLALREGSGEKLKQQEKRPGFFDVLPGAVFQLLDEPASANGHALALLAGTLGALEGTQDPALEVVWKNLRSHLLSATWANFEVSPATGTAEVVARTPEGERKNLRKALLDAISKAVPLAAEEDRALVKRSAKGWLDVAFVLLDPPDGDLTASIPGSAAYNLQVLQLVAEAPCDSNLAVAIRPRLSAAELTTAISDDIGHGISPENPHALLKHLNEVLAAGVDWSIVAKGIADRIRVPVDNVAEFRQQLRFLLVLAIDAKGSNALAFMKELSTQGVLAHFYHEFRGDLVACAEIMAANFLVNPAYERSGEFNNSAAGDALYRGHLEAPTSDQALINAASEVFSAIGIKGNLVSIASGHPNAKAMAVEILSATLNSASDQAPIALEAQTIIDSRDFLYEQRTKIALSALLLKILDRNKLVKLLASTPFDPQLCYIYVAALQSANATEKDDYVTFLAAGIDGLETATWEKLLRSSPDASNDVVGLSQEVRREHAGFSLKMAARDAILALVRNVGDGKVKVSDRLRKQLSTATSLLEHGSGDSLNRDVVDDIEAKSDSKYTSSILSLLDSGVVLEIPTDKDRTLRRIFYPVLAEPTEVALKWMNGFLEANPAFLDELAENRKADFKDRVKVASEKDGLEEMIAAELRRTRVLMDLKDDEDAKASHDGGTVPEGGKTN